MLESVSLQKNRLRSAKNEIFSLLCILVDRPMGGLNPQNPPLHTPLVCVDTGFKIDGGSGQIKIVPGKLILFCTCPMDHLKNNNFFPRNTGG